MDVTAFWSHAENQHTAGVGLLVKSSFLQQFSPTTDVSWQTIAHGRAAALRLDGPLGSLDIYTVYLHSGQQRQAWESLIRTLTSFSRPRSEALSLSLFLGDWNFVVDNTDRYNRTDARWTGQTDTLEAAGFALTFGRTHGFHEIAQEEMTHESGRNLDRGASRLDRIYSNHHIMDQLGHEWGCAALGWVKAMSHHRPARFFRRSRLRTDDTDKPLDATVFRHPQWRPRTLMEYSHLVTRETTRLTPLRKLVLLKEAMATVAERVQQDKEVVPASSHHEKLGTIMSFIRVAERRHTGRMKKVGSRYPFLLEVLDPDDPNSWTPQDFTRLWDHAVDLSHKALIEDLRHFHEHRADMKPAHSRAIKERLHARLRRHAPGGTSTLKAMQKSDGSVTTEEGDIARMLTEHWKKVFSHVQLDTSVMEAWLQHALPPSDRILERDVDSWALTRHDIEVAIKRSGNTMAGPDRLPYEAWRQLGDIAVDTCPLRGWTCDATARFPIPNQGSLRLPPS